MQDVNVVVVFYSRMGSTEQLALAAAVGAVQCRANIRLRRLPQGNEEYVAPREADATWADAIMVGIPSGSADLSPEFVRYFESLNAAGKIGASFTEGPGRDTLEATMRGAGLIIVTETRGPDALTSARLLGRRVADAARSRKVAALR